MEERFSQGRHFSPTRRQNVNDQRVIWSVCLQANLTARWGLSLWIFRGIHLQLTLLVDDGDPSGITSTKSLKSEMLDLLLI